MSFRLLTIALFAGFLASTSWAKCSNRQAYYCAYVTFKKPDPKLKNAKAFPGHCAGFIDLKGTPTAVVFQDKGACPEPETKLSGHLVSICQDTGVWTQATYWFANKPFFCGVSYEQRREEARKITSKIFPGKTTRAEVKKLLKDYEYIGAGFSAEFVEQYYGHPKTLIEVPFAAPGGENQTVSSRATIADIDMPQP